MKGASAFLPIILAAVVSASIGFMLSIYLSAPQDQSPMPHRTISSSSSVVGTLAPPFTLLDIDGKSRQSSDWDGQIRLVNFWATWCPPCIRELPELSRMHSRLGARGFQVLAIADDTQEEVESFLSVRPVEMPVLMIGEQAEELTRAYGNVEGVLPYSVLIDRQGIINKRYLGAINFDQLKTDVDALLE